VPFKIDIGAVYNMAPDRHNAADKKAFVPTHKEMVFDIDMNDYDDVRTCCTGANVCSKCWEYLKIAMIVLTDILVEDFEFENVLWVFSGRRGIHAWVCDEAAREMTNEMRSAVVSYCNIGVGNEMSGITKLSYPLHPRLQATYKKLLPDF
jgi:DNA primase small subunit